MSKNIKINVPFFNTLEEAALENNLTFHLDEFTNEIMKTISHNREIIILKKVIKKQKEKIKELKNNELDYTTIYISGKFDGEKKYKDKIKEEIERLEIVTDAPVKDKSYTYKECIEFGIEELKELLKDNNKENQ